MKSENNVDTKYVTIFQGFYFWYMFAAEVQAKDLKRRPRTSGIFSAPFANHLSNKIVLSSKIFTNTYRMELNLCQLNSVNVLLHIT